jgi:serine/threonine protein kinase
VFLVRKRDGTDAGRFYAMKVMEKAEIIKNKQCELVITERRVFERIGEALFLVRLHCAFETESKLFLILGENMKNNIHGW